MDNTIIIILVILFSVISISSIGGIGYYTMSTTKTTTSTPTSTDTTDTTANANVETCTTKEQADGKCRTYWDCYLGDTLISANESIDWDHTSSSAAWACNEWKDKCNKNCTAHFRSDTTSNPPSAKVEACTTKEQADGKCRTYWDCYLGDTLISANESIDWDHTSISAAWACNEWKDKCNKNCTAKFRSDTTSNPISAKNRIFIITQ